MSYKFDRQKLTELREKKKFTQSKLGKLVGRQRQTINYWESGVMLPTIQSLLKLSDVLDVQPGHFFTENHSY